MKINAEFIRVYLKEVKRTFSESLPILPKLHPFQTHANKITRNVKNAINKNQEPDRYIRNQ